MAREAADKIARILRTDKHLLYKLEDHLSVAMHKKDVLQQIVEENEARLSRALTQLEVARNASAKQVYDALISKIDCDNNKIYEALGHASPQNLNDCVRVLKMATDVTGGHKGFFLKHSKAEEFLKNIPPRQVLAYLKYDTVEQMLAHEDIYEVYSALRFIEGSEWLNSVFFKQYETLTPQDFEERDMVVRVLSEKWNAAAEKFVRKKWHNISHLKEMGVVFVIPLTLGISGELLRMLLLVFHYLHEVPFYSDMFRRIAEGPTTFAQNLVALLRGDTIERRLSEGDKSLWLVVQRYLAKDDENDWRLAMPRINPEAMHWLLAEEDIVRLSSTVGDGFAQDFSFWLDLDWVGDFFKDEIGNEILVSFDLIDTVMSLVTQKELIKYLYHHEEAFWNKIFTEFFSYEDLGKFAREYLLQGYFEV